MNEREMVVDNEGVFDRRAASEAAFLVHKNNLDNCKNILIKLNSTK